MAELVARVSLALAEGYVGVESGRTRDVPDARAIRYYTTLGLLDRPAQMRGRTALYGPRHLRQIAAIKRLQAQGLGLVEVQVQLAGLSDAALTAIARVPASALEPAAPAGEAPPTSDSVESAEVKPGAAGRGAFWRQAPAPVQASAAVAEHVLKHESKHADELLSGVKLAEGVSLVLEAGRALEPHDLEAIQAAAAPLLKLLHARGLVRPPSTEEKS
jgi:DNA-binding transcriptional MerR regulator